MWGWGCIFVVIRVCMVIVGARLLVVLTNTRTQYRPRALTARTPELSCSATCPPQLFRTCATTIIQFV